MKTTRLIFQVMSLLIYLVFTMSCEEHLMDPDKPGNLVPETVDLDPDLPSVPINGILLHAETFGDIHNPLLIFIPGGPGSDYEMMISRMGSPAQSRYPSQRTEDNLGLNQLQDDYFCIFFDPRGAGLSPRFDKDEIDMDIYHDDLNAVIDYYLAMKRAETGIEEEQVYLLGHSFGGLYVTSFLNQYPERVKDVILLEPTPLTKALMDSLNQTSVFGMIGEKWLNQYLYSLDHISYDDHCRVDYHRILGYYESFPELEYAHGAPFWRYGAIVNSTLEEKTYMSDHYDVLSNLDRFKGRALFIRGGKTHAMSEKAWELQVRCYPRSEDAIIPGTGHLMLWEDPDLTVQFIRTFLSNH